MLPYDDDESRWSRFLGAVTAPFRAVTAGASYVAWLIERSIAFVVGFFFSGTEQIDRIGDGFSYFLYLCGLPFVMLGRLFGRAWDRFTPPAVRRAATAAGFGLARFWHMAVEALLSVTEFFFLDRILHFLAWLLQPIWRPIAALASFFIAWTLSREYRAMLWSVPALLILVPLGLAVAQGLLRGEQLAARSYRLALREAREDQDSEKVLFLERKLAQLGVKNRLASFRAALQIAELGDVEQALEKMQEIAPDDEPGFLNAHLWIVESLSFQKLDVDPDERQRLIRAHLDQLSKLGVADKSLAIFDAMWHLQEGDLESAADLLLPLAETNAYAAIQRLMINVELKRWDLAREDSMHVRTQMESSSALSDQISDEIFRAWATAEALLEDSDRLKQVLLKWHEQHPSSVDARKQLANLAFSEFNQSFQNAVRGSSGLLGKLAPTDANRLAELFLTAQQYVEDDSVQVERLRDLVTAASQFDFVAEFLTALTHDDRTSPALLELIGTAAVQRGDWGTGALALQSSVEREQQNAVAWNNLAWTLAHQPTPDLDGALSAANRAVELRGDFARFRETRGQILMMLEHWQEAVEDLEFAANGMPDSTAIHKSLALAYQQLGDEELAEIHRSFLN